MRCHCLMDLASVVDLIMEGRKEYDLGITTDDNPIHTLIKLIPWMRRRRKGRKEMDMRDGNGLTTLLFNSLMDLYACWTCWDCLIPL